VGFGVNLKTVAICVDDGLITCSTESGIEVFIDQLLRNFKITTGTLSNFLGMRTEQRQNGIFVCQRDYSEKVFERFNMHEANSVAAPLFGGFQQIQLRTEGRENGDVGEVVP
jgi:hypothetical protein